VIRDEAALERFAVDESGLGRFPPEAAVLAESAEEVARVLEVAAAHGIPVTPRGAGTGMTGGALPVKGGIVLSTERMTRVRELDAEEMIAVVEPGVITGDLERLADEAGLFYPPDPASLASCSLGGNVAENAGGPRAFKYGTTREYVLGMEAVLMGGERLACGRRTMKGVTGYDVTAALVGSEGTFAVATAITLRLLPRPTALGTLVATFPDAVVAGAAVSALLRAGLRPRALELLDRATIEHMRARGHRLPAGAAALLLIEVDGPLEAIEPEVERAGVACERAGALEIVVARSEKERRELWETRRLVNPTLRDMHRRKIPEDIVVPRRAIPEMLRRVDAISAETGVPTATYGHAGDGNLHVNLLVDEPDPEVAPRLERAMDAVMRATLDLGGTLAGEHGVGLLKMKYLPWEQAPPLLRVQRELKRLFDPRDLLNPGKILPPA
jgi:glycolate oxidase